MAGGKLSLLAQLAADQQSAILAEWMERLRAAGTLDSERTQVVMENIARHVATS